MQHSKLLSSRNKEHATEATDVSRADAADTSGVEAQSKLKSEDKDDSVQNATDPDSNKCDQNLPGEFSESSRSTGESSRSTYESSRSTCESSRSTGKSSDEAVKPKQFYIEDIESQWRKFNIDLIPKVPLKNDA